MTRLQEIRQMISDRIKPALDAERAAWFRCCVECGIPYEDGFSIGCSTCADRCTSALRRVRAGSVPAGPLTAAELASWKQTNHHITAGEANRALEQRAIVIRGRRGHARSAMKGGGA